MEIEKAEIEVEEKWRVLNSPITLRLQINGKEIKINGKLRDLFYTESELLLNLARTYNLSPRELRKTLLSIFQKKRREVYG
jgi:hypothetical protein